MIVREWHGALYDPSQGHDKVWAACLEEVPGGGYLFTTQYGRRGNRLTFSSKDFPGEYTAKSYYDRIVHEKQMKGYQSVVSSDPNYGFQRWPGQSVPLTPKYAPQLPPTVSTPVVPAPQPILLARKNTPPRMVPCPVCREQTPITEEFCDECGAELAGAFTHTVTAAIDPQAARIALLPLARKATAASGLLSNRYRVEKKIGQGGFGSVYRAEDTLFGRTVAVKEMKLTSMNTGQIADSVEAFEREGRLLANLQHPNLPRIYDKFQQDRSWYLVMDFIEGETLEEIQNRKGIFMVGEVRDIGLQLCDVLGYLHRQRSPIIFRDLKPGNIMLTPDNQVYLIDFGIARLYKAGQSTDTRAFGTNGYAAPEQYGKAQTGVTADIYSLGATLHNLLSGDDPAGNIFHFAPFDRAHMVPAAMERVIMQCVQMDAAKRPQSVVEVARMLKM